MTFIAGTVTGAGAGATASAATRADQSTDTAVTTAATAQWRGDYETGDLSQFVPSRLEDAPEPTVTRAIVRQGGYAGRFYVPAGGKRAEIKAGDSSNHVYKFAEGDDRWFGFSTYLPAGFPLNQRGWQVLSQWKNDGTGAPPIELGIEWGGNRFAFTGGSGDQEHQILVGPVTLGTWVDWVVHVRFSSRPSVGYYDVWRDGTKVVSGYHPEGGTLYGGRESYWKMGLYRSPRLGTSATAYNDAFRLGSSFQAVDPASS